MLLTTPFVLLSEKPLFRFFLPIFNPEPQRNHIWSNIFLARAKSDMLCDFWRQAFCVVLMSAICLRFVCAFKKNLKSVRFSEFQTNPSRITSHPSKITHSHRESQNWKRFSKCTFENTFSFLIHFYLIFRPWLLALHTSCEAQTL